MKDKIVSYLLNKGAPATSAELADAVLKMKNVVPTIADRLIGSAVRDERLVYKTKTGRWAVKEKENRPVNTDSSFLLCALLPQRVNHWRDWHGIGLARVTHDTMLEKKVLLDRHHHDVFAEEKAAEIFQTIARYARTTPVIFSGFGNQLSRLRRAFVYHLGLDPEFEAWSLKRWTGRLFPDIKINDEKSQSTVLKTEFLETRDVSARLDVLVDQFFAVFYLLNGRGIRSIQDIRDFDHSGDDAFDFTPFGFDGTFIAQLPESPGVYIMKDRQNAVIYVGKAKNLNNRLSGYFRPQEPDGKLRKIYERLNHIDIVPTGSELEALLLEDRLIREYHPPINTQREIHSRLYDRNRFPQIIILPAAKSGTAVLVFVHPENGIRQLTVKRAGDNPDLKKAIVQFFFSGKQGDRRQLEIVISWLSLNDENVQNIDMRPVSTAEEALRILQQHVRDFSTDKTIYYIQSGESR